MNEKPRSKWYWRLLRWGLIGLAGLITLAAVAITEEDYRGKHEWSSYLRAAEARGEHIDLTWAVPPTVPDDQNFFAAPMVAEAFKAEQQRQADQKSVLAGNLDMNLYRGDNTRWPDGEAGNWQLRTKIDLKPWQTYFREYSQSPEGQTNGFPTAKLPQTPAADVLLALSTFDQSIEALRQASLRPSARAPLAYEKGLDDINSLMPWLAVEKRWTQVMRLRSLAELQAGQSQPALDNIKLSMRLADTLRDQPYLISHLVRIAMMAIALPQPIYEGIAEKRWNDAQLADLETTLATEDLLKDFQHAMRGERTCALASIESWRITRKAEFNLGNGQSSVTSFRLMPSAFFYQNEQAIAERWEDFIRPLADPTRHTISLTTYRAGEKTYAEATNHYSPYKIFANENFTAVSGSILKFAYAQTQIDLARVACALERYRLAHGHLPETLEVLAPGLIPALPCDLINGQPLHYRRTDDGGYVLYSLGWNETDDGGTVAVTKKGAVDRNQGDWVWQLPAK